MFDSFPVWSPDGRRIAFTRKTENSSEAHSDILAVEDGVVSRLVTANFSSGRPAFSPDGLQLTYCQKDGLDVEIYTQRASPGPQAQETVPITTPMTAPPTGSVL